MKPPELLVIRHIADNGEPLAQPLLQAVGQLRAADATREG
jgi:hypothetical protein